MAEAADRRANSLERMTGELAADQFCGGYQRVGVTAEPSAHQPVVTAQPRLEPEEAIVDLSLGAELMSHPEILRHLANCVLEHGRWLVVLPKQDRLDLWPDWQVAYDVNVGVASS